MLFTNEQYNKIYDSIYDWLAVYTPGSRCSISKLKRYQKEIWNPIIETIKRITKKEILNANEQEFLDLVVYNGPIFRIQRYNSRYEGYLYESNLYQSWSRSIDGVASVDNLSGDILLIVGESNNGIDIFGLLEFLLKNEYISPNPFKNPYELCRYEKEEEILYPIQFKHINDVVVVNKKNLHDWENNKKNIPRDNWRRNSIN